jgi:acyl-CoA thioester hydrolase
MRSAPFDSFRAVVRPEWIDDNGHLNMGYYVVVFDQATDAWLAYLGLGPAEITRMGITTFTLESHVCYLREVLEGAPLRFTTRLLGFDEKRIHYVHEMHHDVEGYLAATNELVSLHVSQETRRATPMAGAVSARLEDVMRIHSALPVPDQVGRRVGLRARP